MFHGGRDSEWTYLVAINSNFMHIAPQDIAVFTGFFTIVIGLSVWKSGKLKGCKEDSSEFFLAGRGLTWPLIGISIVAANISTEQMVGMAGQAAGNVGLAVSCWQLLGSVFIVLVSMTLLPKFLRAGIYTMPEYLEYRYNPATRAVMAVLTVIIYAVVMLPAVLFSGGVTLRAITGMELSIAVWLIGLIGAGNMASALMRGLLQAGLSSPATLIASDVDKAKLAALKRQWKIQTATRNTAVVEAAKVLVLAVKPQDLDVVLQEIRGSITPQHLVISIAAGVPTSKIEFALGGDVRVLRAMPNTPALVGKGMTVLVRGRYATAADVKLGLQIFGAVGDAVDVEDERMLDAVTGLSGSGPAYVYLFAEGLIAGGVAAGLTAALAARLTFQTIAGAAAMLLETGQRPEDLRAQVSSPGGTTLAGLSELHRRGFKDALVAAVVAATRRSQELGRK